MAEEYTQEQRDEASGAMDGMIGSAERMRNSGMHILQAFAVAATGVAVSFPLRPDATNEDKVKAVFSALCIVQAVYDEGKQVQH